MRVVNSRASGVREYKFFISGLRVGVRINFGGDLHTVRRPSTPRPAEDRPLDRKRLRTTLANGGARGGRGGYE